jgi:predicted dithiol-disulfide oxidoreductase (DUF899 family)
VGTNRQGLSLGSDFNFDFGVAYTDEELANGPKHNMHDSWDHSDTPASHFPAYEGVPSPNDMPRDGAGMSAFALEDDVVYHTYSAYARGMDVLWGMFQWLDRAPKGRNETGRWYRLHDEYDNDASATWRSSAAGCAPALSPDRRPAVRVGCASVRAS